MLFFKILKRPQIKECQQALSHGSSSSSDGDFKNYRKIGGGDLMNSNCNDFKLAPKYFQ